MLVSWTATAPGSRHFPATERTSPIADLTDHFTALRSHGQGYLEIRLHGDEFPLLTLGFLNDRAVIHLFDTAEKQSLLIGDGTTPADTAVHLPIMDDLAAFSGDNIIAVDRAWTLIRHYIQTGTPGAPGAWREI
ncbi:hypothetical protein AQJ30_36265 [Streptomyces longwoodensis]|uniref:Uncharacterized protein n=2 Tax=Streptomyces longwoodensis TaxID=68231 RepID=A0A101QN30_9ACTN|nr:hypothetical protein AQJ30_36265 [Streptomyces longwoodensis]